MGVEEIEVGVRCLDHNFSIVEDGYVSFNFEAWGHCCSEFLPVWGMCIFQYLEGTRKDFEPDLSVVGVEDKVAY